MIPAPTRYARATDLDHALELLAEPDAKAIAGGQSLIPVMKLRIARPSLVVDISRLELRGVAERDGELHIGPLTTWDELTRRRASRSRGDRGVRARHRRPPGAQPRDDRRQRRPRRPRLGHARRPPRARRAARAALARRAAETFPSRRLLVGPFTTSLGPQELVTDIVVPLPAPGSGSAYASVEHPASGFALAGAAALVTSDGETVALTGVGATPFVLAAGDLRDAIADAEIFGDRFASAEYRRELAVVVAERALARARGERRGS